MIRPLSINTDKPSGGDLITADTAKDIRKPDVMASGSGC